MMMEVARWELNGSRRGSEGAKRGVVVGGEVTQNEKHIFSFLHDR
jgi:hypothetical protein